MEVGRIDRRRFHQLVASLSVGAYYAPAHAALGDTLRTDDKNHPNITSGIASGDVHSTGAILWSRCDRDARMVVDLSSYEDFRQSHTLLGPEVLETTDFTGKLQLQNLEPDRVHFYRVRFQDLRNSSRWSSSWSGSFRTAPIEPRTIRFAWSGDTAGQGYGIDPSRGGMKSFRTILDQRPDFFVNSGDVCYADNPIPSQIELEDGTLWKNLQLEEKTKVAETLNEFRANYRYNLLDENLVAMNAAIPTFAQWDDHETLNNWYPTEELLDDSRYTEKSVALLAARARRAFLEYMPIRPTGSDFNRIYRRVSYGPLLELFFIDLRSHRGPNTSNHQKEQDETTALLGKQQIRWLKQALQQSKATWKVICSNMPIGLVVRDGKDSFEAIANANDGKALGRELEIADLLRFMKQKSIHNVVWLTADVHYAASHYYDPQWASFQDFDPFWEFVSGPLHAGTFGPNPLDKTFGPQLKFQSVPEGMKGNRPPSEGRQFFGIVQIDGDSKAMRVSHHDVSGKELWHIELQPRDERG